MKKLLLMTFAILTLSVFAAEENKEATQNQIEKNRNIATVKVQGADVSLGDSFMAAFGMAESGAQGGNSSGTEGSTSSTSTVGAASVAANTAAVNANNSVTIVTPYGKY